MKGRDFSPAVSVLIATRLQPLRECSGLVQTFLRAPYIGGIGRIFSIPVFFLLDDSSFLSTGVAFVLPFAFMNYFPATFLLHKTEDGLHLNPAVGLLTPVVGLACATLAYGFWRIGIDRYQGTGS